MSDDQDWRLAAELDDVPSRTRLDRLIGRSRGPDLLDDLGAVVPHEVVITHDGNKLFAYTSSEPALTLARQAIETVLAQDGVKAEIRISHWDEQSDEWLQTDPPLSAEAERAREASQRDAQTVETRSMAVTIGKMYRPEVEQTMRSWAEKLGLECTLVEHPHLLDSQVAFTVTGQRHMIDEFVGALKAEEMATMRTERSVMLSPL